MKKKKSILGAIGDKLRGQDGKDPKDPKKDPKGPKKDGSGGTGRRRAN